MGASFQSSLSARCSRRGFALLLTLTLLSFLVLLLVGLATYTRVETAIAGNSQRQAQARENALFALNIALSQLQKHLGPDQAVTATAQGFGGIDGTRHYTGVWSSAPEATEPLTWLVSGNEAPRGTVPDPNPEAPEGSTVLAPFAVTPAEPGTRLQTLVGQRSTDDASRGQWVDAPVVDLTSPGVPGVAPNAQRPVIGRYAWWVGDQGVKAPIAVPESSAEVDFPPYDSPELRRRLRQQMTFGAGPADGSGEPVFEPQDSNNVELLAKVAGPNQLPFLRNSGNTPIGTSDVRRNFHAWSPNNFAVLADARRGGLKQDLSLVPTLLGNAFAAWANYPAYMEKFAPDPVTPVDGETPVEPVGGEGEVTPDEPTTPTAPPISPAYGPDPLRRRYVMTPHLMSQQEGGSHQIGPVLTYFLLTFNVRKEDADEPRPLEVRARWMVSLWNPYTSALVPENLRLDIEGLPESNDSVRVVGQTEDGPVTLASFSLQSAFGDPMQISLPWNTETAIADRATEDRQSWLPGRVYTWRSMENLEKTASPPSGGFPSEFYSQSLNLAGDAAIRAAPSGRLIEGNPECVLQITGSQNLRITLWAVRPEGAVRLGRFTSPAFLAEYNTTGQEIRGNEYQFGYVFRLAESTDTPADLGKWLSTTARDPRRSTLPEESFVVEEKGNDPAQYGEGYSKILSPGRLLSRSTSALSYNEDVPLFELPRSPLVSMGALQHFRLVNQRPFMIGNPWGADFELNNFRTGSLFDRFYFSGLAANVTPTTNSAGDLLLPNPLLKSLRKSDGSKPTLEDMRPTPPVVEPPPEGTTPVEPPVEETPPTEETPVEPPPSPTDYQIATRSTKHLLQGGAFNVNSTSAAAWAAVLRGIRFTDANTFSYLSPTEESGTAGDDATQADAPSSEARFFRFSQSAQETYKAEPGFSAPEEEGVTPPNTHLFRRGMRTLTGSQVSAFAGKIAELVAAKHAAIDGAGGPFRSIEEFLSPSPLFAGVTVGEEGVEVAGAPRSLLEAAIADTGINAEIAEFSSQWLTQGDVMTALAPILFPRSDTFLIRTYGEAVNPATGASEGRAWAEAIVQRVPEYFDPSDPPETLAPAFDLPSDPENPESTPTAAHTLNKTYGRRLKVVSFRWLTRLDI